MATHQHTSTGQSSTSRRKGSKGNHKDIELNRGHHGHANAFEMPAVTTSGMKTIEMYISKTFIEGKQWYRCKWQNCTYSTIRSDSIVRHMRKHTGERPYKCWFCSYATIQSSALKIHMRRHTGERPYICKYENCGKRFAVLNTLVVHERTHTGYKPYKCSFSNSTGISCNFSTSDRCKLAQHVRKSHQVEMDANKVAAMNISGQLSNVSQPAFPVANGSSSAPIAGTSSSHSLALVSGAMSPMSPSHLLSSSLMANYSPFIANSSQMMGHNSANSYNQLKAPASASNPFVPLNFLSVISSSENIQNSSTNNTAPTYSTASGRSKQKSSTHSKAASQQSKASHAQFNESPQALLALKKDPDINSIKRFMIMIDKKIEGNGKYRYSCKWPSCNYAASRSDSIVRHIRSHTGEKPYICTFTGCNFSTITGDRLKKHLSRHVFPSGQLSNVFN